MLDNYNPSLTIVNDHPSLTIVFLKNNRLENGRLSFLKKRSFSKTIVIRFLKVQNDRFFLKTKQSFLKTIEKRIKNYRLTIVFKND